MLFANCFELTKVTLGKHVERIGKYTFYACWELTEMTTPETLTEIGEKAFFECNKLVTVRLNRGLKTIGSEAFQNCPALLTIFYAGTEQEWKDVVLVGGKSAIGYTTVLCADSAS